jgi:arabinosaccharide transport system substrate-binding protein
MRKLLVLAICIMLVASLVGCGTNKESEGEAKGGSDSNKLTVWVFADIHKKFFEAVAEEFKKTHPDVAVEITLMEFGALYDKYTVISKSGGEGAPDLIDVEQGSFPKYIRGDVPFEPLNEYYKKDNLVGVMSEGRQALYTVDGKEYGVEHAATASALYYRKDLFDKAGIDVAKLKTWDEFTEAAKKLVGENKFIFPAGEPWNATGSELTQFEMLIKQEGGDIVTPEGGIGVNTPEGLNAIKRLKNWKDLGIMDKTNPEGPAYWEAFKEGRYIATYGPDWWANMLVDNTPDLSGKWAAVPMPLGGPKSVNTSVWGGTGLAISKFSNNKELAWEFLKLAQLTPDMSVKRFEIINLFPALLTSLDKPGLHAQSKYSEYFGGQDLGELYGKLVENAPRQNQAWWRPLIGQAWEKYQFDYAEGKMTPEQFLANVEKELKSLRETEEAKQGK